MKYFKLLLIFQVILLSIVVNYCEGSCYFIDRKFEICKDSTTLVSVKEINNDKQSNLKHPLYIKDKNISSISANAFKNLTIYHLMLELADEKLILTQDSFNGLPKLGILEFFSGKVILKENLFIRVNSLYQLTLIIDGENKKYLNNRLTEFNKLKVLKIHNSNLETIESTMFMNFNITINKLDLTNNNISHIEPNSFNHLEYLGILKLDNNKIKKIEHGVFNGLKNLDTLSITRNQLSNVSRWEYNYLFKLKNLNMAHNLIDYIEVGAFEGLNLDNLDLSYNELHAIIPQTFQGLSVKYLDLTENENIYFKGDVFSASNVTKFKFSQKNYQKIQ